MPKTFVGKLLADIAKPFTAFWHLFFKSAADLYKSLPDEVQQALLHGSGVISIINEMLSAVPKDVIAAIQQTFPDLDAQKLTDGLFTVAHQFGLLPKENDLEDCIALLQSYLSSKESGEWEKISSMAGQVLAFFLAPAGTKFMSIVSLIEAVYQWFFQKKDATPELVTVTTSTTSTTGATT